MTSIWWLTSLARLLRDRDVGPANFFRIGQAGGDGWCHRWELAIIEVKFLNPIPESKELGSFDELWHRIRCHEPEHVGLDPLVQLDQGLQLGSIKSTSLFQLDTSLERPASKTGHDLGQVGGELVA